MRRRAAGPHWAAGHSHGLQAAGQQRGSLCQRLLSCASSAASAAASARGAHTAQGPSAHSPQHSSPLLAAEAGQASSTACSATATAQQQLKGHRVELRGLQRSQQSRAAAACPWLRQGGGNPERLRCIHCQRCAALLRSTAGGGGEGGHPGSCAGILLTHRAAAAAAAAGGQCSGAAAHVQGLHLFTLLLLPLPLLATDRQQQQQGSQQSI